MMSFIYKKLNNRKGFSLIELIVVIAILGILAAVAIPRVTTSLATAKTNTDNANVRAIRGAVELALAEGAITPPGTGNLTIAWDNDDTDYTNSVVTPTTNEGTIRTAIAARLQVPPPRSQATTGGFLITITNTGVVTVVTR